MRARSTDTCLVDGRVWAESKELPSRVDDQRNYRLVGVADLDGPSGSGYVPLGCVRAKEKCETVVHLGWNRHGLLTAVAGAWGEVIEASRHGRPEVIAILGGHELTGFQLVQPAPNQAVFAAGQQAMVGRAGDTMSRAERTLRTCRFPP